MNKFTSSGLRADEKKERALLHAAKLKEECRRLAAENRVLRYKAEFYDDIAGSTTAIRLKNLADRLCFYDIDHERLLDILKRLNIFKPDNFPNQIYVDEGYFRVIEQHYVTWEGPHTVIQTLVYEDGVDFVRRTLIEEGFEPVYTLFSDFDFSRLNAEDTE